MVPVSKLSVTEQLGLGINPSVTWNLNAVSCLVCFSCYLFLLWFPFPVPEKVPEIKSNMLLGGRGGGRMTTPPQIGLNSSR